MRKLFWTVTLALLIPTTALAEGTPKTELFGGYSYLHSMDGQDRLNLHGWNASIAGNLNDWFGLVADFHGHYGSPEVFIFSAGDLREHSFFGGPKIAYRKNDRFTPFGHALFGMTRTNFDVFSFGFAERSFTTAFGGGLDVNLSDRIAVRAVQADWVQTHFDRDRQNSLRLSFGVVFRFGEK